MSDAGFEAEWARASAWLAPALHHGRDTHSLDDVKAMICDPAESARFWIGREAAAVTEIRSYPNAKVFHIWLCGGDLAELTEEMLPIVEHWAIEQGCQMGTIIGRDGWRKIMPDYGYAPVATMFLKDLRS